MGTSKSTFCSTLNPSTRAAPLKTPKLSGSTPESLGRIKPWLSHTLLVTLLACLPMVNRLTSLNAHQAVPALPRQIKVEEICFVRPEGDAMPTMLADPINADVLLKEVLRLDFIILSMQLALSASGLLAAVCDALKAQADCVKAYTHWRTDCPILQQQWLFKDLDSLVADICCVRLHLHVTSCMLVTANMSSPLHHDCCSNSHDIRVWLV